jgi:hypothetical protein
MDDNIQKENGYLQLLYFGSPVLTLIIILVIAIAIIIYYKIPLPGLSLFSINGFTIGGGGSETYIEDLIKLYPKCKYETTPLHNKYTDHKTTYGEMEYSGIKKLHDEVKTLNKKINSFIDIGSGRGKLCFYMAGDADIQKSVGIEIVKERHDDALHLLKQLPKKYAEKVQLINADIFNVKLASNYQNNRQTFVWFSNLCFDQNIIDKIFIKMVKELPSGSLICCSKICQIKENNLKLIKTTLTDMSWNKDQPVHIYEIL